LGNSDLERAEPLILGHGARGRDEAKAEDDASGCEKAAKCHGGSVNATFTSLLASAQLCKIEPWAYLRDLFCLLSNWPAHQMLDLAPLNWAQTSARKDVRALLAANKFRDLTIDAG